MEDNNPTFDVEEQEALELLASIQKVREQEKKLLTENAFVYFCHWLSFNKADSARATGQQVQALPDGED